MVQNFAIIEEVIIDFSNGFNVITGETGAGKSILLGALSLILGNRADASALKKSEKKCITEAKFSIDNSDIKAFLKENELDEEAELIVRREIAPSGKSRSFINDTPVSLSQLKALSSLLVDLHKQFDTLQIGDADFQRKILDVIANNANALSAYKTSFLRWKKLTTQLETLRAQKATLNKELDYIQFQYEELETANFAENEIEDVEKELELLSNATEIKSALSAISYALKNSETPVSAVVKQLANQLSNFQNINPEIASIVERLYSAQIEISDIADEAESLEDKTEVDDQRLAFVNERLALGYKLMKKHNVSTTNELRVIQKRLHDTLSQAQQLSGDEEQIEKEIQIAWQAAKDNAKIVTNSRKEHIAKVSSEVNTLLAQVGMPNAKVKVQLLPFPTLQNTGAEEVEILFDANNSQQFEPVRKVASGGELSRLMLCIKTLLAQNEQLPTLIFDEIDTGISGEAAVQVGNIMKTLAQNLQIISITHLPQIAGKANRHFFVYKKQREDGTIHTGIEILNQNGRIHAIAQMIGGENPSEAALASAAELVEN